MMARFLIPCVLLVVAVAAGCGDDDSSTSSAPTVTAGTEPATTTAAAQAPTLGGTSWSIMFYRMENGSMTNVLSSAEAKIEFAADGTVTGSTGCNEFSGTWDVAGPYDEFEDGVRDENDGQTIRFTSLSATERACEGSFLMEQDVDVVNNLRNAEKWFVARGKLALRGESAYIEAELAN